jgi:hypothetical protein
MKTFCLATLIALIQLFSSDWIQAQSVQLTQQQKDQIRKEVKAVGDSIMARLEKLNPKWVDYYIDSPDWGMVNADGSRWDYQSFLKVQPDFFSSIISWKWTTTYQDFMIITPELVICAWGGKDVTVMKSPDKVKADTILKALYNYNKDEAASVPGDKIIFDPHAYTLVFKKVAGQWKVIYQHDSGIPVTQKASNI